GLSLARSVADKLPKGYKTKISDRRMYGEALLDPTIIYAPIIEELFNNEVDIHYMANITGHGWRKLMRHRSILTYRITRLPPVPPVLQFLVDRKFIDEREAYGNLNMGAGFALFVPSKDVQKVINTAKKFKVKAYAAGVVEAGKKQVIIEPKNIIFAADTLQVKA
ncbi:MAG: AIR synthase-related protein, partial [Patescibacteria group bacterium]